MQLRRFSFSLFLACFVFSGTAFAEPRSQVRELYETGMAHYQLEEWDQAIASWEQGFRIRPTAEFLYNIAQAHRFAKRPEKALSFYKKYLRMDPKSAARANVERQIEQLEAVVASNAKAATVPPQGSIEPPRPEGPAPAPRVIETPAPIVHTEPVRERDRPLYKKGWFWGAVVGGAVVVADAITLGVVLGTRNNGPDPLPAVSFGLIGGAR